MTDLTCKKCRGVIQVNGAAPRDGYWICGACGQHNPWGHVTYIQCHYCGQGCMIDVLTCPFVYCNCGANNDRYNNKEIAAMLNEGAYYE